MTWKRRIAWIVAGLAALLIVVGVGGYFYLQSASFQQFALQRIVQEADAATGCKAQIGGLQFDLHTLTANLYNITVHGTEAVEQPPLLHVDQLTVQIRILSLVGRKFSLQHLLIAHPVAHLQVSKDGKTNLPSPPPSNSHGTTNLFDLAIGHAQLTNGEIDYNDRKAPLDADLFDLNADVHFVSIRKTYEGQLSYARGHLRYAEYAPVEHDLNARFSASPERFDLQSAELKVGASTVRLHAEISNYSNPIADANYEIQIHAQDFAQLSPAVATSGDVSLTGKLNYQSAANQPLLRCLSVTGRLASEVLTAAASGRRVELRRLHGDYQLANGRLQVSDLRIDTLGGRIDANLEMNDLDTTPASRLRASVHEVSLRALQQMAPHQALHGAKLSGKLNGTAVADWKGAISNLHVQSDLTLRALAGTTTNPSASDVPVDGAIHLTYDGPRQALALRQTSLRIPSAALTAQGEISSHSNLQLQINASDLHQVIALASSFATSNATMPAISGSAALQATVRGPITSAITKPKITGHLSAQNLQVEGSQWSSAKLNLQASPSGISISDGALVNAEKGQATFSGNVALRDWVYQPTDSIKANLNAQRLRLSDLQRLAKQNFPVSGELSANISISGSEVNPAGSGTAQITNARAYGEPIENLAAQFHASKSTIVSTLNVSAPAGAVTANLSYTPKTRAYKVRLDAPSLALQKLQTFQQRNLGVTGTLSASANGEGTLDDPQLTAIVQLPQLEVRNDSISGLKAEARIANHSADFNFDTQIVQAAVHGHGRVALSGDYYADAQIDTGTVPLDVLLATYATGVPQGFTGQTELHASLKGPLKNKSQLEAHISIPVLNASYQSLQIGISNPIRADYVNSVITLQPAEIQGTGTTLRVQGQVPISGNAAPTLTAQGSIDARILRIVDPDVQSSGVVAVDVRASGFTSSSSRTPAIQGQLEFKDVALSTAAAPVGVKKLNGTVDITSDHLQIAKMTAQVGGGPVSLAGSVAYQPGVQFNLALQGQGVRLLYPAGTRSSLDANLTFSGTTQGSVLNGRVVINSLGFTPDFDLSTFADQFGAGPVTPSQPGFADTVKLAIAVQSQGNLSATSSQVSIAGRVALQVGGTAADPVITGRTNLTSGELFYRNVRYQLQRGFIQFGNPNETQPDLNVSVTTTVEQYNLTITLRGPLDKLTTAYTSDPPLATADIINLIAQGKTTQESAAATQSTDSIIASQAVGQLSNSVQKLAGISSLEIDPTIGGSQNPSARVAIQQRVTKNLLFTFSTDVSQPGSEIVQGEYQVNKHWSVSAQRDQLGGVAVDGRYHTHF